MVDASVMRNSDTDTTLGAVEEEKKVESHGEWGETGYLPSRNPSDDGREAISTSRSLTLSTLAISCPERLFTSKSEIRITKMMLIISEANSRYRDTLCYLQ